MIAPRTAHPRCQTLVAITNSAHSWIRRLDGKSFQLGNLMGTHVSKKSTNLIIDRCERSRYQKIITLCLLYSIVSQLFSFFFWTK